MGITYGALPAVPKDIVGRTALLNLLRSNLEMFSVCVDRCYDRDTRIATGSFQVGCPPAPALAAVCMHILTTWHQCAPQQAWLLWVVGCSRWQKSVSGEISRFCAVQVVSEVYSLHSVQVEPHVVLSLVLYKMVDASVDVREDALHMLQVLSMREWQTSDLASAAAGGHGNGFASRHHGQQPTPEEAMELEAEGKSGSVLVLGALQDSYQQFQYELAVSLARYVPECRVLSPAPPSHTVCDGARH